MKELKIVNELANLIKKNCYFSDDLNEYTFYEDIVRPFSAAMSEQYPDIKWCYDSGATKLVFIFKELGFVLKVPFNTSSEDSYQPYYDEDGNELDEGEYCSFPFTGSPSTLRDWDYCHAEIELYSHARENNVADYLGLIEELDAQVDEYPIYVQPYFTIFYDKDTEDFKDIEDEEYWTHIKNQFNYGLDPKWVRDFVKTWGDKAYNDLVEFCEDFDITDLHRNNIGYCGDKPIILDYAGFYS